MSVKLAQSGRDYYYYWKGKQGNKILTKFILVVNHVAHVICNLS